MNLHEDIHRIKEVMGISQPKELTPVITNRFVYHNSNPFFRDQIKEMGLIVKGKSETWLSDTPIEGDVIFATNSDEKSDWFDSTYDDDIYQIDTTKISNDWYEDPNFSGSKHIITFNNIPKKAIKLIYKGTGNDLQENVDRDKRPNKIMKMIDDIGLYNTVKMVGGYESLLSHINPEDISESDKIKFIRDVVTSKGPEISGRESISIYDLGVKPIWYDEYKNKIRVITTMYKNGVNVNVYINEIYDNSGMILYSHMPEDAIDRVFKLMIDLLEDKKEEMTEGLHDTSWENDEGDKITLIDLLNTTEDIPVKEISLDKIKTKLLTWDGNEEEVAKIEKANLRYPILIFVDDNNKFISIIDGHHRAHKALRKGLKKINAKIIPINSLPKNIRKVFKGMGEQEEMTEGELTERCWKGYKQKGMKTMFGKKYPNCVKVKK